MRGFVLILNSFGLETPTQQCCRRRRYLHQHLQQLRHHRLQQDLDLLQPVQSLLKNNPKARE